MATTTQTNAALRPAARPIDWGPWLNRLLATALVAAGLGLLATELGVMPADWSPAAAVAAPVAVMAAGTLLAAWGWSKPRPLPAFAVERGHVECGELAALTGSNDLQVQAFAGSSQLAVGQFPDRRGPKVHLQGTAARLTLEPRRATPFEGGPWSVALAKGLPWELFLRARGGHLDLNLRDLTIASLRVHSDYGNVDLTLPAQGPAEMQLKLALGDLTLAVPDGVEARLRVTAGTLATVKVDERRFIKVAAGEWMTPLYPTTAQRCSVVVDLATGDLRVV
jgi:hypothetical protein